jgi:AcrR family transcriptional regulator
MTSGVNLANSADRRVQRTRRSLHEAMMALMVERDWDAITVQDICDRANVGRSTFYTHFDDKDELLGAGFNHLRKELGSRRAEHASGKDLLGFARGLIEHAYDRRELFLALLGKRSGHLVQKRFRQLILELVKNDLAGLTADRDATAHYVAGAFFELLSWWLSSRNSLDPGALEALFRRLTASALAAARGARGMA